jgi:hypothetical protein
MNPFSVFSKREQTKQYDKLSGVERITLGTSRFFLATKHARTFFFGYFVCLHALVFLTLLHLVHHSPPEQHTLQTLRTSDGASEVPR